MITTLLLQTMMAANTSRPGLPTSNSANDGNTSGQVAMSLADLEKTATDIAQKTAAEFKESLKGQSWGNILFGSPKRTVATVANSVLLAYPLLSTAIQFGFVEQSDSSPIALSNISLSNAKTRFDGWSNAGKGIAISAFVSGFTGLIGSATQYCLTKSNDLKEALQSDPFTIESQTATDAAKNPFDNVAKVVVGTGDDEMTITLAAFKKRTGFDASNPFAQDAFFVILENGDRVQISEEGVRMDQASSN